MLQLGTLMAPSQHAAYLPTPRTSRHWCRAGSAPEAQRGDALQVFKGAQLGGGVPLRQDGQIFALRQPNRQYALDAIHTRGNAH